jgi:DNA-binding response OmpR family regulator
MNNAVKVPEGNGLEDAHILLVEDEERYVRLIAFNLKMEGYKLVSARTAAEALNLVQEEEFDLILLDLGLPDQEGLVLCQEIRALTMAPILILTARAGLTDKVNGLKLGADDYITKPFALAELSARIQTHLRRYRQYRQQLEGNSPNRAGGMLGSKRATTFELNELFIDFTARQVQVRGQPVHLSATEYRLLEYFAHNAGRLLTKELLLERVWNSPNLEDGHLLRLTISRLRQKLGDSQQYLQTRPGFGYVLVVPNESKTN